MEQDVKLAVADDLLASNNSLASENSLALANSLASSDLLVVLVKVDGHKDEKVLVVNTAEGQGEKGVEGEDKEDEDEEATMVAEQNVPCVGGRRIGDSPVRVSPDRMEVFERQMEEQEQQNQQGEEHEASKERGARGVGGIIAVAMPYAPKSGDTASTCISHIQATTAGVPHGVKVDVDVDPKAAATVVVDIGHRRGRTAGDYAWSFVARLVLLVLACLQWLALYGRLVIAWVAAVPLWLGHSSWYAAYTLVNIAWICGPVVVHMCSNIVVMAVRFVLAVAIWAWQCVHHQQVGSAFVDLAAAGWIATEERILAGWHMCQVLLGHVTVPRWIVVHQVVDGRLTNHIRGVNASLSRRKVLAAKLTPGNVKVNAKSKPKLKLKVKLKSKLNVKSKRKTAHHIAAAAKVCGIAHGAFAMESCVVAQEAQHGKETATHVEVEVACATMAMEQQQPAASIEHVVDAAVSLAIASPIAPPSLAPLDERDAPVRHVLVEGPTAQPRPHAQAKAQEQQEKNKTGGGRRPKQATKRRQIGFGHPYKTDVDSVYMNYADSPEYRARCAESKQKRFELENKSNKKTPWGKQAQNNTTTKKKQKKR